MGACASSINRPRKYSEVLSESEQEKTIQAADRRPVKILLLGSSGSGKTTIFKQMRLVHYGPFTRQETEAYRQLIYLNITDGLHAGISRMNTSGFSVTEENRELLRTVAEHGHDLKDDEPFLTEYRHPIEWLWKDPNVQAMYANGNQAGLPENLSYFCQNLDRLFNRRFVPSNQDILHAHVRSTGIAKACFSLQPGRDLLLVDIGGSRSERRKWRHCADGANAVVFMVNLAGYNQSLREDEDTNQMEDALDLWEQTCRAPWFKDAVFILLLNQNDVFEEKIMRSNIKDFFPDYKGPAGNADAGRRYFKDRFRTIAREAFTAQNRQFYCHFTTATNTMNIRLAMAAVQGTVLATCEQPC
ncbi:heterotrimeric G protein alpha subunit 4 [Lentinus brumalis]|uniref:Heterotrimeric G protein alpha subunit 4 n=1 Tax=Lentinus brumalis TaxID=2498619 RepID=A0A371CQ30_9APHY|nr:heterotrimeric G protein alpha subunit 4 [Polyporus brumalis]